MRNPTTLRNLVYGALFCALLVLGAGSPGIAAQVAASVEYDFVQGPADLPGDFQPLARASLKFLSIKAIDAFQVDAALWQPEAKSAADTTMIVMVHGSGSSYKKAPQSALGRRVAAQGYAALIISTRQHDDNINTENFFDVRRDIDAAVQVARALGYKKLVLQGHSLGNIQVQFYAATNWDSDIKGVMLLGMFGNLPWKTRNILVQNEEGFQKLIDASFKALREGKAAEILPVKMGYYTGEAVPVTAQHFLTYRWDKTSAADGTFWISRIPQPILLVRDQADVVIQPFEPYMLLSAAHSEGSLVSGIDYVLLPNSKAPSLQGHVFDGNEQPLADVVVGWLKKRGL